MGIYCNVNLHMGENIGLFFILADDILFDCVTHNPIS